MPQLPTEAAPLRACRECRKRLDPPTGTGTFVHGVGAVGYQTCPRCGARWRYLWSGREREARSRRQLLIAWTTIAIVAFVAVAAAVAASFIR